MLKNKNYKKVRNISHLNFKKFKESFSIHMKPKKNDNKKLEIIMK